MTIEKDPVNFEVMDDEARASAYADNMNDVGVARVLKSIPKNVHSLEECVECGDDIPKARQLAYPGVTRCTLCQGIHEKQSAQYSR